jgi:hypothetical protein
VEALIIFVPTVGALTVGGVVAEFFYELEKGPIEVVMPSHDLKI